MVTALVVDRNLQVMEPVTCSEVFDSDDYLYQVKWDGVRMLSFMDAKGTTLINKRHHDRTAQYPEIQELSARVAARTAILDGEIVVLKNGKPNFPSVMSRDLVASPARVEQLRNFSPINYMVFDLLYLDGNNLIDYPLEHRQERLRETVNPGGWLHLVEDFGSGSSLFHSVCKMDMEGIVAKRRQSRYIAGKKHRDWLKIKYRQTELCLVGGYTLRGRTVNSLLLGLYQQNQLIYVGRAGSGLSNEQEEILSSHLPMREIKESPFANLPRRPAGFHFVNPEITVEVEFQEWTDDVRLRAPVINEFVAERGKE